MFSTSELDYIKSLTEKEYNNGNKYYVCITNNPIGINNNNNIYDVMCYYSKDKIIENTNNFVIPNNSRKCSLDSNSYSTNNTIDKLECVNFNGNVTKNTKEYVYSNVGEYANIIQEYQENNDFIYNIFMVGLIILSVMIIYKILENIF